MSETMDKYIFANDDFEKAKEVLEKHAKIINQVRDRLQRNPLEVTFEYQCFCRRLECRNCCHRIIKWVRMAKY